MEKKDDLELKIENVAFDTAKCTVKLFYDLTDESLRVLVFSRFSETQSSKKEWLDMSSYGQCCLETDDPATMQELADCIKNEPWLQVIGKEKTPFEDEKIKQAVLERLYNTR